MTESFKWHWNDPKDGFGSIVISSWQHYIEFVYSEMLDYETYVWRGQRNSSWALETTLDRLIKSARVSKIKQYNFAQSHLEQFKYATRGRRGPNPRNIESDNEWWALGQHHGLATPLLDWTLSPFVAAYFAFIETANNQTKYRVVYALHKPTIEKKVNEIRRQKLSENKKERENITSGKSNGGLFSLAALEIPVTPEIEFITPLSDENHHLVNQGGLFTKSPPGKNLDTWVKEKFSGENDYNLLKIFIPNDDREKALKTLNRMNINHLSLFPDLYGASRYCNLFGEIEKY